MNNRTTKTIKVTVAELYRTTSRWLRYSAVAVAAAFVLGYAGTPVAAQEKLPNVTVDSTLDTSLPALAVLVAKETSATAGPVKPPTDREILLAVCKQKDYGEDCAKILYGMVWKESRFESRAVGDHGKAQGYFQIHYRLHKISLSCAQDLKCSATWSLGYMERNGYPRYATHAVQCHNGCGAGNGYAAAVKSVGIRRWKEADVAEKQLAVAANIPTVQIKTVAARLPSPVKPAPAKDKETKNERQLAALIGRER